jgi:hypothetical protein
VSIALENRHNWSLLLLFGVLINNIIGAAWAAGTIAFGKVNTSSQIGSVFICCLMGNIIVIIIIVPSGLRYGTSSVLWTKFFVRSCRD